MTRNEWLKKPHLDVMNFVLRKGIALGLTFFLQVGDDVLPGDRLRLLAKQFHRLLYPRFMMPRPPVSHAIAFGTLGFIKPAVYFFIRIAEQPDRFLAVSFKLRHRCKPFGVNTAIDEKNHSMINAAGDKERRFKLTNAIARAGRDFANPVGAADVDAV